MVKVKEFLFNMLKGGAIGLAMIIPGVSGGTLAVLMGVYDKIIDSISGLFKHFKKSVLFLLPILLGAVIAFAGLYFPLKYALLYARFPTIMLFAGFILGSCYDLIIGAKKNGFKAFDLTSAIISFIIVVAISCIGFIPSMGNVNLGTDMAWHGYILLAIMGILASCALVVPGISGSMLLLIFGYYDPILNMISAIKTTPLHAILVLGVFAIGLVIGFFTIAKLMQFLLNKYRRATMWAIVGFVIGSIPAVIITFFSEDGGANIAGLNALQISLGVVTFIIGGVATFLLSRYAEKRTWQPELLIEKNADTENQNEE